jgi:dTDP-4-dehydrorhamnose 3,5-epimerase
MTFVETGLPGLVVVEPRLFTDARGYFYECYNEAVFAEAGITCRFVQDNQSKSRYGVVRGLHCQRGVHAQAKLVRVPQGAVLDVAVDIRHGSPTFGKHFSVELSGENSRQLFMPRGFLHGFSVLSDFAVLHYKCDNAYNRDAETGVRYDDPALGIDWGIPGDSVLLSEKDGCLKGFSDVAYYRE